MAWPTYAYMNSLSQMKSPSDSYIQLTTKSASATVENRYYAVNRRAFSLLFQAGSNANYLVSATFPMSKLYYKVFSANFII